jgi:hypothetical protein
MTQYIAKPAAVSRRHAELTFLWPNRIALRVATTAVTKHPGKQICGNVACETKVLQTTPEPPDPPAGDRTHELSS